MKTFDLEQKLNELRKQIEPIVEKFEKENKVKVRSITYDKIKNQGFEFTNEEFKLIV